MRTFALLFIFLLSCGTSFCQDTAWISKEINPVLSVGLPKSCTSEAQGFIKSYSASNGNNYFAVAFYDTAMNVRDGEMLKISLSGFAKGFASRVPNNQYKISVSDTTIGNTKGILINFMAIDSSAQMQRLICYLTMANDNFYSFQVANTITADLDEVATRFFNSINFRADRIKETNYKVDSLLLK